MYVFRSKIHQVYTQYISKLTLSYLDDKRFICKNNVNTYAWGHYKINSPLTLSSNLNLYGEFMQADDDEMFLNLNLYDEFMQADEDEMFLNLNIYKEFMKDDNDEMFLNVNI